MFKGFFGRRSKVLFGSSSLMLIGTSLFYASPLNVQAISVKTRYEGFVKSKTFLYLKTRVKKEDIKKVEDSWDWNKDSLSDFLKNNGSFFDVAAGNKTELEKLLTLLKFFESHCKDNDTNLVVARQLKDQCLEEIDKRSGELLANYIENTSLEGLVEILGLNLIYDKFKNESIETKYQKLLFLSETINNRVHTYFTEMHSFCEFCNKEDYEIIANKIYLAEHISEVLCHVFSFRKDNKKAFGHYRQILYIATYGLEIFKLNLSGGFKDVFAKDFLIALTRAISGLNGKSSIASKILKSTISSFNKSGLDGLKKVLNFWSEKNKDDSINDMIYEEMKGNSVDQKSLFEQADKLVSTF